MYGQALGVVVLRQGKAPAIDAPGEDGVLHAALLGALHNAAIGDVWLEDLADHAVFRPDGGGDGVDGLDKLRVQHLLAEAGPVVDIQVLQLLLLSLRQQGGSIDTADNYGLSDQWRLWCLRRDSCAINGASNLQAHPPLYKLLKGSSGSHK